MNTGVTINLFMRKKNFIKKIMRLILVEVIMSDRQIYSSLELLLKTENIRLNWRLDSTVIDYVLFIFIAMPL